MFCDLGEKCFCKYIYITRWWFEIFLIFIPTWGNDPIWLIFFKWIETTNKIRYIVYCKCVITQSMRCYVFFSHILFQLSDRLVVLGSWFEILGTPLSNNFFMGIVSTKNMFKSCAKGRFAG